MKSKSQRLLLMKPGSWTLKHDRLPFRSSVIALVVQNLPKSVLYIHIILFIKDVVFFIFLFPSLSLWLLKLAISSVFNTADVIFVMPFFGYIPKKNT